MIVKPIPLEELCQKLDDVFSAQDGNKGSHSVLDTNWSKFLEEFSELVDINQLLRNLYSGGESLDVLDVGCGSSLTLFQALESIEDQINRVNINGYGLTASLQFLNRGSAEIMKSMVLKDYTLGTPEYRRVELLLDGVQENESDGLHRYSPNGNLMRFKKGDVHYLEKVFAYHQFDLIYSSAAYPHLLCPWLAFEKSANALKNGGILLIDSMPTTEIVDKNGEVVSPEEYERLFRKANPGYEIYFQSSSNPFYAPLIVQKRTDVDVNILLHFGQLDEKTITERVVGIIDYVR